MNCKCCTKSETKVPITNKMPTITNQNVNNIHGVSTKYFEGFLGMVGSYFPKLFDFYNSRLPNNTRRYFNRKLSF